MKETTINLAGLVSVRTINNGVQLIFKFDNKRGASVVKHEFSYGTSSGLWELAVLDSNDNIDYSTTITYDVAGYLSDGDVNLVLARIKRLKE